MRTFTKFALPVGIALLPAGVLAGLSIYSFGTYGWVLFLFVPFVLGYIPGFISTYRSNTGFTTALKFGLLTLFITLLLLIVLLLEGLVCISMALPVLVLMNIAGAALGYRLGRSPNRKITASPMFLLTFALVTGALDMQKNQTEPIDVRTELIVDAPISKVWTHVLEFDTIQEKQSGIFRLGIACPVSAVLRAENGELLRYCNFTTGAFVEPITDFQAPVLLGFDVQSQPDAMSELNPFGEVHPPHLEHTFKSVRGQFQLEAVSDSKTRLIGTTWCSVNMQPAWYWNIWTRFIVQRIHGRVLRHIAREAIQNSQ